MAEEIKISTGLPKSEIYEELIPQIKSLLESEPDAIANMANLCAVLKTAFNFFWVGFYIVKNEQLVLGPFQGMIACTRINRGKGVCGTAWNESRTIIVPDVEQFPGHIACSSLSRSEIVVPVIVENSVAAVLDIDSDKLNQFDETDARYLEKIIEFLKI